VDLSPRFASALAILSVSLAAACGGTEQSKAPAKPSSAPADAETPATAPAPKPKGPRGPIDPATVGAIHGVVRFDGEPPARKPLSIGGTGGCPEHATPPLSEDVIVANGKLANVFVYVKDGATGWDIPPPKDGEFDLDQKGCVYTPHVLGLRVGQKLLVRNTDPTTHNVHIRSRSNDELNPTQTPNGQPVEWTPKKKEIGVSFECNLHPWMRAVVHVVDHPWFAVTGDDGAFAIEGLPPGDYLVAAWHEKFGQKTAKVTVVSGGGPATEFVFKATDKPR